MKNKKSMLADDKARVGYQDAGEVKRKKIIYNLNEDSGNLETEGGTYIREALEDKLKRLNSDRERLAESGVKDTTEEDLKIMIEIEEIENSLKDIDGVIERDKKYGGGMLSDDKDRMAYAEGEEVGTHIMPDGTEMAGSTHAEYEEAMDMLPDEEMDMVPDEEMEQDHLDFIINESLDAEEETYLMEMLQADDRLSMIFDKVMDTASEFSGDGPVEGLGSEVSDSIPARLSDGEFVMTAQATDEIGSDNLQNMMDSAEEASEDRQKEAKGGEIEKDKKDRFGKRIDKDIAKDEIKKSMLSINPRLKVAIGGEIEKEKPIIDRFGKPVDKDIAEDEIKKGMLSVNPRLQ